MKPPSLTSLVESVPLDVHHAIKRWHPPHGIERETGYEPNPDTGEYEGPWVKGLPPDLITTIRKHLEAGTMTYLGTGSSRKVFRIPGGRALKVALNGAGISQNKNEVKLSKGPLGEFAARVWKSSPDGKWIVMEEVVPAVPAEVRGLFVDDPIKGYGDVTLWRVATTPELWKAAKNQGLLTGWQEHLIRTLEGAGVELSDALVPSHWGKTEDGRMVLLDYGLTTETFKDFYD